MPAAQFVLFATATPLYHVEDNRPQWIEPWSAPLSNMEWQINRIMHMSGRCVGCRMSATCPLDLPIGLLCKKMGMDIKKHSADGKDGSVLSTYNIDKEKLLLNKDYGRKL